MFWLPGPAGASRMWSAPPARTIAPFEERHDGVCIAAVTGGTFHYRSTLGSAVLAPRGPCCLGNDCHCFECSHEHGIGDRCLSFRFTPEFLERVVSRVPGARRASPFLFRGCRRMTALLPVIAAAEAAATMATPAASRNWRCALPVPFPERSMEQNPSARAGCRAMNGGSAPCCVASRHRRMGHCRSRNWRTLPR